MPSRIDVKKLFFGLSKKWISVFTSKSLILHLKNALTRLEKEKDINIITPPIYDIFKFARDTDYESIKAVIIDSSPYPNVGEADGLCFSSQSNKIPTPLYNIYKCLTHNNLINEMPKTANLKKWAGQGILMINMALTTRVGEINIHNNVWKHFMIALIKYISDDITCGPNLSLAFLLWGDLEYIEPYINEDCIVYKWSHPSSDDKKQPFLNCDHFIKLNEFLHDCDLTQIDWNPVHTHIAYTDGACTGNGKGILAQAGYSCYFTTGTSPSVIYGKVAPVIVGEEIIYGTNQRGEGLGIITAIKTVLDKKEAANLTVVTDSNFWIEMIHDYMPNWERKGIDFKTKKNSDITIELYSLVKKFSSIGTLEFVHVASHNKDPDAIPEHVAGNEIADKYACLAKKLESYDMVRENIK